MSKTRLPRSERGHLRREKRKQPSQLTLVQPKPEKPIRLRSEGLYGLKPGVIVGKGFAWYRGIAFKCDKDDGLYTYESGTEDKEFATALRMLGPLTNGQIEEYVDNWYAGAKRAKNMSSAVTSINAAV